jgi:AAA+ superfamily predicted ATPase
MPGVQFPDWAELMRRIFRAETIGQFILYGNVNDFVEHADDNRTIFYSLKNYLNEVIFAQFDVVIMYDRSQGISIARGGDHFLNFLNIFDKFHGTRLSADLGIEKDMEKSLDSPGLLPRAPSQALELIDRFMHGISALSRNPEASGPRSAAVIIDYANFLIPRGESLYLSSDLGSNLIRILDWAEDVNLAESSIVTCLISENLLDLNELVVNSSYNAKIQIKLPEALEIGRYLNYITKDEKNFRELCQVDIESLPAKLVGLNRIGIKNIIYRALRNQQAITFKYLTGLRKENIEKESAGRLEFIETQRTLDDVAGHAEAKKWLREDALLMRKQVTNALPMGYLIAGRIGTGKTYLVQCFAGECGVPFVEMKNFREKWVGATEGNLEKIFHILHALGQVVVFVDEADQVTGRRGVSEGDSGLSGRVYGMLAKEMSETENRGRIIWIFATSRPDLLEVDLKREGRLDIHIPLFPPVDEKEKNELFLAMARKLKLDLSESDLPKLAFKEPVSGNELEGILVRAIRRYELQPENEKKPLPEVLKEVAAGFRPSAHTGRLDLMDLLAVRECTDDRFLPERFTRLSPEEVEERIIKLSSKSSVL